MGCGKRVLVALIASGAVAQANAQDLGARAQAHAGAARADASDVAALSANLAALSLQERYDAFAGAGLGPDSRFLLHAGAVDTRTSAVSLGAAYERITDDVAPEGAELPGWKDPDEALDNPALRQRVYGGMALPVLARHLSFAATVRYDWVESELGGASNAFDFGFSAAGKPSDTLTLAAGLQNVLDASEPRSAHLAARWAPGEFLAVEADIAAPAEGEFRLGRFTWSASADASVSEWLVLRAGYANVATESYIGAGVAAVGETASLDYGLRVQASEPSRNWHSLGLKISF